MRQIVNARREAGGESCSVLYADTGEDLLWSPCAFTIYSNYMRTHGLNKTCLQ